MSDDWVVWGVLPGGQRAFYVEKEGCGAVTFDKEGATRMSAAMAAYTRAALQIKFLVRSGALVEMHEAPVSEVGLVDREVSTN
jgi:hypothetical protein